MAGLADYEALGVDDDVKRIANRLLYSDKVMKRTMKYGDKRMILTYHKPMLVMYAFNIEIFVLVIDQFKQETASTLLNMHNKIKGIEDIEATFKPLDPKLVLKCSEAILRNFCKQLSLVCSAEEKDTNVLIDKAFEAYKNVVDRYASKPLH